MVEMDRDKEEMVIPLGHQTLLDSTILSLNPIPCRQIRSSFHHLHKVNDQRREVKSAQVSLFTFLLQSLTFWGWWKLLLIYLHGLGLRLNIVESRRVWRPRRITISSLSLSISTIVSWPTHSNPCLSIWLVMRLRIYPSLMASILWVPFGHIPKALPCNVISIEPSTFEAPIILHNPLVGCALI